MTKKINIGILIDDLKNLNDGEIKTIFEILKSSFINVHTIFKINPSLIDKNSYSTSIIYKLISLIEKRYSNITRSYEKNKIRNFLKIQKKKIINIDHENEFIKNYQIKKKINKLDLILLLDDKYLKYFKFKKYPKHGIWTVNYASRHNYFAGFWECYLSKGVSNVLLKRNTSNKNYTFDLGHYSTRTTSWFLNREFIFEKASSLIIKNLKLIYTKNKNSSKIDFVKTFDDPSKFILLIYILKKYPIALIRNLLNVIFKITKVKYYFEPNFSPWNIYIGNKNKNENINFRNTKRIKPKSGEEWADPFLINYKDSNYLFFENYEFKNQKGKISFSKIINNNITKIFDALNLDYHLSYPFLWFEKDCFFMMPESAQKKCVQIWKSKKFPHKWTHYKKLFKGKSCVDTTILDDKAGNRWIFTNMSNDKFDDHNSELYIFKTDKNFNKIISHKLNPVIIDSRYARNAGNIFYDKRGFLLRPSQKNTHNLYGGGLNIRKIKKLNIKEFVEENFTTHHPNRKKNVNIIHHLSQNKNSFAYDMRNKNLFSYLIPKNY